MSRVQESVSERELARHKWHEHRHGASGGVYGLAFVGAAVYFIQQSDTFGMGVPDIRNIEGLKRRGVGVELA